MNDLSRAKPDDLTMSIERLRALDGSMFECCCEQAEIVAQIEPTRAVREAGGISRVLQTMIGWSGGTVSKRLVTGKFIQCVTLDAIKEAGYWDTEILYYAARAWNSGKLSAMDALEEFKGLSRADLEQVSQKHERDTIDALTVQARDYLSRGLQRCQTLGITPDQAAERLGVMCLEAEPDRLRALLYAAEGVA